MYGSPRVLTALRIRGQRVSRKRVARLIGGEQGLVARKRRRFVRTTDSRHAQPVAPNLFKRNLSRSQPNSTWTTDTHVNDASPLSDGSPFGQLD